MSDSESDSGYDTEVVQEPRWPTKDPYEDLTLHYQYSDDDDGYDTERIIVETPPPPQKHQTAAQARIEAFCRTLWLDQTPSDPRKKRS